MVEYYLFMFVYLFLVIMEKKTDEKISVFILG